MFGNNGRLRLMEAQIHSLTQMVNELVERNAELAKRLEDEASRIDVLPSMVLDDDDFANAVEAVVREMSFDVSVSR